jgi:hypothetical protein
MQLYMQFEYRSKQSVITMKKDSLICFRASSDLRELLTQVSKEDNRSLSSTIEIALTTYLKGKKAYRIVKKEKRQYPRKAISVPAVINQQDLGQMGIGSIMEISLGGVRIIIPKDFKHQIIMDTQGSKFEIVFNLPNENKPIKMCCESKNVDDSKGDVYVGASFVDADFQSYKALHAYLM